MARNGEVRMNDGSGSSWDWRRIVRLTGMAMLVFAAVSLGPPWFHALVPIAMRRRAVVRLLRRDPGHLRRPAGDRPGRHDRPGRARCSGIVGRGASGLAGRGLAMGVAVLLAWASPRRPPGPGWPGRECRYPRSRPDSPTRSTTARWTSSCSAGRAPRASRTTSGSRWARSSPGGSARRSRIGDSPSRTWPIPG